MFLMNVCFIVIQILFFGIIITLVIIENAVRWLASLEVIIAR